MTYGWLRYLVAGIAIVTALILVAYLVMYRRELKFQGLMLKLGTEFLG